MAFEFEAVNNNHYEEEYSNQQKTSSNGSKTPLLYLKEGITTVRILPPKVGSGGLWFRKIVEHNTKIGEKFLSVACPRQIQQDCPFCEELERLTEEGETANNVELLTTAKKNFGIGTKFIANVICYSSPDPEVGSLAKGVMVMKFGTKIKQALLEMDQAVDTGWANITDVNNGVDIRITRSGKGLNTTYSIMPLGQRSNIQAKLAASGIDLSTLELFNLTEVLVPRSYEDLKATLNGQPRTPGTLPKPQTQTKPVPVAQSLQVPVVATEPQMVEVTVNGQKMLLPASALVSPSFTLQPQPVQSLTSTQVQAPQMPSPAPTSFEIPVREVK